MARSRRRRNRRRAMLVLSAAAMGAAVADQLRQPEPERTWHGTLLGVVPYDLRVPTVRKVISSFWDPDNAAVLKPKSFGVGWDVNFAALLSSLSKR